MSESKFESTDESIVETSVNVKTLRSREMPIDETDPALRSKVDVTKWGTKTKNLMMTDLKSKTSETEIVISADRGDATRQSELQRRFDEELIKVDAGWCERHEHDMEHQYAEERRLRNALETAHALIEEQNGRLSEKKWEASAPEYSHEAPITTDTYEALRRLSALMIKDGQAVTATAHPVQQVREQNRASPCR